MTIGERIRLIRNNEKLSRSAFGARLGVSGDVINNWERDRVEFKEYFGKLICNEYSVNENFLFNGIDPMYIELSQDEQIANFIGRVLKDKDETFKKRYISMLSSLDESGWEALEKYTEILLTLKMD